jgi:hypothetical protein
VEGGVKRTLSEVAQEFGWVFLANKTSELYLGFW